MSGVGSLAATAVEPQSMDGNDSFYAGESSGFKAESRLRLESNICSLTQMIECHKQRKREEVVVACRSRGGVVLETCSGSPD